MTENDTAAPVALSPLAASSIELFRGSDHLVEQKGARIKGADFHSAYAEWCEGQQLEALPLNSNAFGAAIESWGIQKMRSNGIHYLDIALA